MSYKLYAGTALRNCIITFWRSGRRIRGFGVRELVLLCREWMVGAYDKPIQRDVRRGGRKKARPVRKKP